jgi:hypothetical protein
MKPGRRDALWLAAAVLLHALLLLIPPREFPSATETARTVSVTLLAPREEKPLFESVDPPAPPPEELLSADKAPPPQEPPLAERQALSGSHAGNSSEDKPLADTSTARLLDSASRFKWPTLEEDKHRQLGVYEPQGIPDNRRPVIPIADNRFDGMFVPEKTEIVDRWLAADGTHNVVLNTSSGDTLCGRARPWNPMNPLIEPVMTFWKCGGGGKRAFKIPDRYMRSRQQPR